MMARKKPIAPLRSEQAVARQERERYPDLADMELSKVVDGRLTGPCLVFKFSDATAIRFACTHLRKKLGRKYRVLTYGKEGVTRVWRIE